MNAPTHYDPNSVVRQQPKNMLGQTTYTPPHDYAFYQDKPIRAPEPMYPLTPTSPGLTSNSNSPHILKIRQEPEKGRVVLRGKEKERKPLDPPPILELMVPGDPTFLHNPYLFCTCQLWHPDEDKPADNPDKIAGDVKDNELLLGQLVSSLHRLKDLDNSDKGFFVFGDLSVALIGRFRLRFSLWEYSWNHFNASFLANSTSIVFEVIAAKEWDGIRESTSLSRTIADQGIKLRLRKESRHPRGRPVEGATAGAGSSAPLRPHPSAQPDGMSGLPEPSNKRQRSYGAESGSAGSSMATTPYANAPYSTTTSTPSSYSGYTSSGQPGMQQPQYYNQQYPAYPAPYNYQYQQSYGMPQNQPYRHQAPSDPTNTYSPYASSGMQYGQSGGQQYVRNTQPYPPPIADGDRAPTSYGADSSSYARPAATGMPTGGNWPAPSYGGAYGAVLPSLSQGTGMSDPSATTRLPPISSSNDPRASKVEHASPGQPGPGYGGYSYAPGGGSR